MKVALMVFALALFFFNSSCIVFAEESSVAVENKTSEILKIGSASDEWKKTITVLTGESLWSVRDAYDASHVLMVPMHFAFIAGDTNGIKQFEGLMYRFASQELPGEQLREAQWMYLVSRYLALRAEFNYPFTDIDIYLVGRVSAWLHNRWVYEPAYQWGELPLMGTKSRIEHIRSKSKVWPLSYYSAVTDYELFLFSAASDILFVRNNVVGTTFVSVQDIDDSILEMVAISVEVIRERGAFTKDDGWLFQVGTWTDHPDFRFSGHAEIKENLNESPIKDVAEDSSHSHRWPLFFRSMIAVSDSRPKDKEFLLKAYSGFTKQLIENVIVIRDGSVLLKNYMDGTNGLYRYKYETVGGNDALGYAPYALSGILGESWYPFSIGISDVYKVYEKSYPLKKDILELYVGPNTTRARNPLFVWPDFFTDGLASLLAKQGYYVSRFYNLNNAEL